MNKKKSVKFIYILIALMISIWLLFRLLIWLWSGGFSGNWCNFENKEEALRTGEILFYEFNHDHKILSQLGADEFQSLGFEIVKLNLSDDSEKNEAVMLIYINDDPSLTKEVSFFSGCWGQFHVIDAQIQ